MLRKSTRSLSRRVRTVTTTVLAVALVALICAVGLRSVFADSAYFNVAAGPLAQNWTNVDLITANDDYALVPSIVGYLGGNGPQPDNIDPRTLVAANLSTSVDVTANRRAPFTPSNDNTGGVFEYDDISDPSVALIGSASADAPNLVLYLDTRGATGGVNVQYNIRDLDGSADDNVKQVDTQYRVRRSCQELWKLF